MSGLDHSEELRRIVREAAHALANAEKELQEETSCRKMSFEERDARLHEINSLFRKLVKSAVVYDNIF